MQADPLHVPCIHDDFRAPKEFPLLYFVLEQFDEKRIDLWICIEAESHLVILVEEIIGFTVKLLAYPKQLDPGLGVLQPEPFTGSECLVIQDISEDMTPDLSGDLQEKATVAGDMRTVRRVSF